MEETKSKSENENNLDITEFIKRGQTITISFSPILSDVAPYGRAAGNCNVKWSIDLDGNWKEWPRWNMMCCDIFQIYRGEYQVWTGYNYTGRTEIISGGHIASWPNQIRSWKRIKD